MSCKRERVPSGTKDYLDVEEKMQNLQMTRTGMDVLVMAELMRLQRDQSLLESLYQRLPDATAQPHIDARFLSLWSDVEKRADRLEYMLDHMAA
jgi:hypothetical protein